MDRLTSVVVALAVVSGCSRQSEVREDSSTAQPARVRHESTDAMAPPGEESEVPPAAEAPCTLDSQCGAGRVCEGCREDDRHCIRGCREDEDCSAGETCQRVQCIRCPCPPLCG
jgi:hypothetical protein